MNWNNIFIGLGIFCGLLLLAFASGAYWQYDRDRNAPARVTLTYIEHPVVIPAKEESKPAQPKPPEPGRNRLIDSLISQAKRADSLEVMLRDKLEEWTVQFDDTISVKDSLGSFFARTLTTLDYDPVTEIIKKMVEFSDVKFTAAVINTEKYIDPSFWQKLYYGSGIAAVIIVIFLILGGHV